MCKNLKLTLKIHHTEIQIKEKAKVLFFKNGLFSASVQEIADFSNVKRTLINYYFRSKENLLKICYWELVDELRLELGKIYCKNEVFHKKVAILIDYLQDFKSKYPYLEYFNVQQTILVSNQLEFILNISINPALPQFLNEIQEQMDLGNITKHHPKNFMINLFSLTSHPALMQSLYEKILEIDEEENALLIKERKDIILQLLIKKTN